MFGLISSRCVLLNQAGYIFLAVHPKVEQEGYVAKNGTAVFAAAHISTAEIRWFFHRCGIGITHCDIARKIVCVTRGVFSKTFLPPVENLLRDRDDYDENHGVLLPISVPS